MAATTVTDFYTPYVNPGRRRSHADARVDVCATVGWGIVQLGVALAAQFMARSVLDAGLSVLSLGSGPVLGAFLLGTLSRSMRERDVFTGMVAGLIVMAVVWWATPIAFTWFVADRRDDDDWRRVGVTARQPTRPERGGGVGDARVRTDPRGLARRGGRSRLSRRGGGGRRFDGSARHASRSGRWATTRPAMRCRPRRCTTSPR